MVLIYVIIQLLIICKICFTFVPDTDIYWDKNKTIIDFLKSFIPTNNYSKVWRDKKNSLFKISWLYYPTINLGIMYF